jgi:hypothetical protein
MLYSYGVLGFFVPIVWSVFTLNLLHRPEVSGGIKGLTFWLGVLLVIALAIFVLYADVTPWLRITWSLSADNNS